MSNFPFDFDDDTTLPPVNDNITEIGAEAINALRDAVFSIEQNIGIGAAGTTSSIATRLGISLNPDGTIKPSAITGLGLVTLPITQDQIANNADIPESKLKLDHKTQNLYNYIRDLSNDINVALGWISATGTRLDPHLIGAMYRHPLRQIDVDYDPAFYFKNKYNTLRDNTHAYDAINDLNTELLEHQWADGSNHFTAPKNITTFNGSTYTNNYAHPASGIFLNTDRFTTVPQTAQDLQQLADYIDSSSWLVYGNRIKNLYSNGISRTSASSTLLKDVEGTLIVPNTQATAYLLNDGTAGAPIDSITNGDDLIEFKPSASEMSSNSFDAKFALVKIGDIITINYGTVEVSYLIKEKKYIQASGSKKYVVRIAGKNIQASTVAIARINKPLFNNNKYGVLAVAAANNDFNTTPSLIIGQPRGAQALGVGFNPDHLSANNYLLYLVLYRTGDPANGYHVLPGIDVTGNLGTTPGKYTLDSVVEATNNAFRQTGYNYRFIAFSHNGEFGIMLADSYNNAGFSIVSGVVNDDGTYNQTLTNADFAKNVVGLFSASGTLDVSDALGFGPGKSNFASPLYKTSYGSPEAALLPTKIFLPLKRNNYYVNAAEKEKFDLEYQQLIDSYGDGYWIAQISNKNIIPGTRTQVTYRIPTELDSVPFKEGKTIVVQPINDGYDGYAADGYLLNYGRFTIESLSVTCAPSSSYVDITVYDAIHATGISPSTTSSFDVDGYVRIYFNSDSVSFNKETATDFSVVPQNFKRYFEIYIDEDGKTFTHERARFYTVAPSVSVNAINLYTNTDLAKLDFIYVSPKLRGYQFGTVNKITLYITSYSSTTGIFSGYLCKYDGVNVTNKGALVTGKKGEITRFYDETNIDFIDVIFDINSTIASFTNQALDIQLLPTLSLDEEIMLLGSCQLNDATNKVNKIKDQRQFGNTSEKDLTTSALNFISLPEKLLHGNGVIRGFDLLDRAGNPNPEKEQIFLNGGTVLVNGKIINVNNQTVILPLIQELYGTTTYPTNWIICINDKGEYQPIPLLDYDPILGTVNDPTRIFTAVNLNTPGTYKIEATTFSNLINNRKDLVPLYIVASTSLTLPFILEVTDVRRYVNDVDNNLPLKLTTSNSQGNFKNVSSIFNWLTYNNNYNGIASVKGAFDNIGTVTENLVLDFTNLVVIDGENNATLTMEGSVKFGNNITFKNTTIIFNSLIKVVSGASNITFENCNLIINNIAQGSNVFEFNTSKNINFKNTTIVCNFTGNPNNGGSIFDLKDVTEFDIKDGYVISNFIYNLSTTFPGNMFNIAGGNNINIDDVDFSGNFSQFAILGKINDAAKNVKIINNNITTTYTTDDGLNTAPDYDNNIFRNSTKGYIYSEVIAGTTLSDILVDNNEFNFSPGIDNPSIHRYPFVNIELTGNDSKVKNFRILNNKFNDNNIPTGTDTKIAAICFTTPLNSLTSYPNPIVEDIIITDNICNNNQSILITTDSISGTTQITSCLMAKNCKINNNICGSIGYLVSLGFKVNSPTNIYSNKEASLIISNNNTHFIGTLDGYGKWLQPLLDSSPYNKINCNSGNIFIEKNICNWIHGYVFPDPAQNVDFGSTHIINNKISGYNPAFLTDLGENNLLYGGGYYASMNVAIKIFGDYNQFPERSPDVFIQNNSVEFGTYYNSILSSSILYGYENYILVLSSHHIQGNILKGIDPVVAAYSYAIAGFGMKGLIESNTINRGAKQIAKYIYIDKSFLGVSDDTNTIGQVVDNIFDSETVDGTTEDTYAVPNTWICERNKNQTGYALISVTNQLALSNYYPLYVSPFFGTTFLLKNAQDQVTPLPVGGFRSQTTLIYDPGAVAIGNRNLYAQENIEKYLPNNVRILELTSSLKAFGDIIETNPATWNSNIWMNLSSLTSSTALDMSRFTSATDDDTSINEFSSPVYDKVTGSDLNAGSRTKSITINLENYLSNNISYNYITGKNKGITLSLVMSWRRTTATDLEIMQSPIRIKYRW